MDAREYHERTKHTVQRLRASRHSLDWANQPLPFKIYPHLEPIPLPRDLPPSGVPAFEAVASPGAALREPVIPDLRELARLLHYSAGIVRVKEYPGGPKLHLRAAACTGALYHIDLYLVCGELPDLQAGVYHFGPHDFALRRLRPGDQRGILAEATAGERAIVSAPMVIICTSTFWRNAWKYQARTYRHCFWDNGTVLANLLALAAADGVPARLVTGFVDRPVNELLGLDSSREVALSLVAVGSWPERPPPAPAPIELSLDTVRLSEREVSYPIISEAHEESALQSAAEVGQWRVNAAPPEHPPPSGRMVPLPAPTDAPSDSIDQVILRRGSTRNFRTESISLGQLSILLRHASGGIPADFLSDPSGEVVPSLNQMYLIVNAVDGLEPGTYVHHPRQCALESLRGGTFRREAGFLGLGQGLPADASVNCYFLTDLDWVVERYGNRGYRAAQLEAAVRGGKLYLGAYALGLGATGLTFFDDDVIEFFSPHAAGKSVMFLIAIGRPARTRARA